MRLLSWISLYRKYESECKDRQKTEESCAFSVDPRLAALSVRFADFCYYCLSSVHTTSHVRSGHYQVNATETIVQIETKDLSVSAIYQSIENSSALSIGVLLVWLRRSISSHFLFSTLHAVDRGVSPRVSCIRKQKVDGNSLKVELERDRYMVTCVVFHADHGGDRILFVRESWGFLVTFCR